MHISGFIHSVRALTLFSALVLISQSAWSEPGCGPEKSNVLMRFAAPEIRRLYFDKQRPLINISFQVDLAYAEWLDARVALYKNLDWEAQLKAGDPIMIGLKAQVDTTEAKYTRLQRNRHQLLEYMRKPDEIAGAKTLKMMGDAILAKGDLISDLRLEELKLLAIQSYLPSAYDRTSNALALTQSKSLRAKKEIQGLRESYDVADVKAGFTSDHPKQLTGRDNVPGQAPKRYETPDSVLFFLKDGRIRMYGSGRRYYEYPSFGSMARGEEGRFRMNEFTHPDGTPFDERTYHSHEASWDNAFYEAELGFYKVDAERMPPSGDPTRLIAYNPDSNAYEFSHGGAISAKKHREGGLPTDPANTDMKDNWTRRRYAFEKSIRVADPRTHVEKNWPSYDHFVQDFVQRNADATYDELSGSYGRIVWERHKKDLLGKAVPMTMDWNGHGYGSELLLGPNLKVLKDDRNRGRIRFEAVIGGGDDGKQLGHTKIFEISMTSHYQADLSDGTPKLVLDSFDAQSGTPLGGTRRSFNPDLTLVEGPITSPNYVEPSDISNGSKSGKTRMLTGFSADDYATDRYKLALGTIEVVNGVMPRVGTPIRPITTGGLRNVPEIRDFAQALRKPFGISWGPARPFIFKVRHGTENHWFVLFHGVDETVVPAGMDPRRNPPAHEIDYYFRNQYLKEFWWEEDKQGELSMLFTKPAAQ